MKNKQLTTNETTRNDVSVRFNNYTVHLNNNT